MKVWQVHEYGPPGEALRLDDVDVPEPGAGQLRVAVRAAALNLNDADMCRGIYPTIAPPLPFALGMEVTGTVDATGPGLDGWLGRRVVAVPVGGHGGYAEQVLTPVAMTFDAPSALDDEHAAAFMVAFHTAHLALHRRARLQPGETLLVHSAAGGVGSAALQLGVVAGARVLATAGGPAKVARCRELGAELAIDYHTDDFAARVLDATDGRGADVICDLVGGEVALRSFACIAREGRYLAAGFSGGQALGEAGLPPRAVAKGNFSIVGVMMSWNDAPTAAARAAGFLPFSREVGEEIHRDLVRLLDAGRIRPQVGAVVRFDTLPDALEALEAGRTIGKTVVRVTS
ncbi:MAG TPA: NADPH:quinone oxidoreductase family protein [Acidimicrobiia bacterium]